MIFAGDLNIRDRELVDIGGLPTNIYDVWEITGSRKECLYTWDTYRNTNLRINSKFKPRFRFDRIYCRLQQLCGIQMRNTLKPVYSELEGLERLVVDSAMTIGRYMLILY